MHIESTHRICPPNFIFTDLDLSRFKSREAFDRALEKTLKTICDTYEQSVSEYMEEALVEAMQYDIEEGNFSATLLEKLGRR